MAESSGIDTGKLDEVRLVMGEDFDLLISAFEADCKARLQGLQDALGAGDLQKFARICHTMKGSASNLGLVALALIAQRGEQLDGDSEIDEQQSSPQEVLFEMRDVAEVVFEYLHRSVQA